MSSKGDQTRLFIRTQSRKLFAARGYADVTMQDICQACDLSRGGLYRHYVSTGEIFCAILADDEKEAQDSLKHALERGIRASTIFRTFLRNRIQAAIDPETSIENAVTEFATQDSKGNYMLRHRGETSIEILTRIIGQGVADGDFSCQNPTAVAKHVLWMIEGMTKHSLLMPLSQTEIDEQIVLIEALLK